MDTSATYTDTQTHKGAHCQTADRRPFLRRWTPGNTILTAWIGRLKILRTANTIGTTTQLSRPLKTSIPIAWCRSSTTRLACFQRTLWRRSRRSQVAIATWNAVTPGHSASVGSRIGQCCSRACSLERQRLCCWMRAHWDMAGWKAIGWLLTTTTRLRVFVSPIPRQAVPGSRKRHSWMRGFVKRIRI